MISAQVRQETLAHRETQRPTGGEAQAQAGERRAAPSVRARAGFSLGSGLARLAICSAALWPIGPALAQDVLPEPPRPRGASSPAESAEIERLRVALASAENGDSARETAATALIALADKGDALRVLTRALESDDPVGGRRAVAAALSQSPLAPAVLAAPLIRALESASTESLPVVLRALGRYRSKAAVRAVFETVLRPEGPEPPPAVLAQATATLAAQTGMVAFGGDVARWRAWWDSAQWLPEAQWRQVLLDAQGEAAREARQGREAVARGLVDVLRRLHAAAPEEARSDLVVEMLTSGVPEARLLGLELTRRALLNARIPNEAVTAAVAARLTDPAPSARNAAASILERLARPDLSTRIMEALQQETDPDAAAAMLRALARTPLVELPPVAARWLTADPRAEVAAIEALEATAALGLLTDASIVSQVRAALLDRFPNLPPAGMRLLVDLGEGERVIALLESPNEESARAAAEALSGRAAAVDALVIAARRNPALFDWAVRALTRHRPTAEGFAVAATLPASSAEQKSASLEGFARALPPGELLKVARSERDPVRREALLAPASAPEFFAQAEGLDERIDLAVLLTRNRLEQGRAGQALAVLDAVPSTRQGPRLISLRVAALLCLNRIDDAAAITEPREVLADAWLQGLEAAIKEAHAREIADQIEERFGDSLSAAQRSRLETLERALPAREEEPGDAASAPPKDDGSGPPPE